MGLKDTTLVCFFHLVKNAYGILVENLHLSYKKQINNV